MRRGYIKLWRKSKDSTVFAHDGLWKLWTLCLMSANREPAEVSIHGILEPIKINPGQFLTGRFALHYDYHQGDIRKRYSLKDRPTPYTLIRWLQSLEAMQLLSIETCNKYSIVTVINWEQYQAPPLRTPENKYYANSEQVNQAILANSEHQKKGVNADELEVSENDPQQASSNPIIKCAQTRI